LNTDTATSRERPAAGLTVVLVEPSRVQAGIIGRYLGELGVGAVHVAGTGREGLEVARRERAAVVICSMHLADMTGADLARAVVADPARSGLGVVVATSAADAEHAAGLPADPRVAVLPKPFNPEQLARAIAAVSG
jgi:two-component system chemotaxis response regulator CheY